VLAKLPPPFVRARHSVQQPSQQVRLLQTLSRYFW
jgi:hypothetical protein